MATPDEQQISGAVLDLADKGYWPAVAARCLAEGKYSRAVEICLENLPRDYNLLSGHLIYGTALYLAGQIEPATEQFYQALALDPDNIVALKYLGDIKFKAGDEFSALAHYQRVLEIDPDCQGLRCALVTQHHETTRTITITRGSETEVRKPARMLRNIPFYTETMADLYLAQGHTRLAAEVYEYLNRLSDNPRLKDKLARVRENEKEKE
ncbi:MAG: hypothetical protein ACOYVF_09355 [Candidatus Zixiibacteriota bacterium]